MFVCVYFGIAAIGFSLCAVNDCSVQHPVLDPEFLGFVRRSALKEA